MAARDEVEQDVSERVPGPAATSTVDNAGTATRLKPCAIVDHACQVRSLRLDVRPLENVPAAELHGDGLDKVRIEIE